MNIEQLRIQIQMLISSEKPQEHWWTKSMVILHFFKDEGGTQLNAIRLLDSMRTEAEGTPQQEMIEDIMDFVVGFCRPSQYIWETTINKW